MKKQLCVLLAALTLCTAGLTACGGSDSSAAGGNTSAGAAGNTNEGKQLSIDAAAAADRFKNEIQWKDTLSELEPEMIQKITGVGPELYNAAKIYVSSGGGSAEEIAVFEGKDIDSAAKIEEAYKNRVEAQKTAFENYVPEELTKLGDPVLTTAKNYVFVCISDDRSKAMEILSELIG